MSGTAAKLTWTAIILIICLLVGGIIYAAANTKAKSVAAQINGTTSCTATTCTN